MMAHITYLSDESMRRKFDRARRSAGAPMTLASDFEVEHYLDHQAEIFLARFDPHSYLYLSRVMDYFEPFAEPAPDAVHALPAGLLRHATGASAPSTPATSRRELRARGADVAPPRGRLAVGPRLVPDGRPRLPRGGGGPAQRLSAPTHPATSALKRSGSSRIGQWPLSSKTCSSLDGRFSASHAPDACL